jgi:hypothetical protein
MSDPGNSSVSSWPGFLAQVNKAFDLVRDIFGYALPGGIFLGIGVLAHHAGKGGFSLEDVQSVLRPYGVRAWAAVPLVIAVCYAVGDVLAATAYLPNSLFKWAFWMYERHSGKTLPPLRGGDWLHDNPTEVTGDLLEIRRSYPEYFSSLDRRETLTLLAGSTGVALLGGWYVFCCAQWGVCKILVFGGAIVVTQFLTGLSHLRRVRVNIRFANDKRKEEAHKPATGLSEALVDLINAARDKLSKQ